MHVYQGDGHEGTSIVDYGVTLNIFNGKVTVEYNDHVGDFYKTLKSGQLDDRGGFIQLDKDQMAWLEKSKTWVSTRIDESK